MVAHSAKIAQSDHTAQDWLNKNNLSFLSPPQKKERKIHFSRNNFYILSLNKVQNKSWWWCKVANNNKNNNNNTYFNQWKAFWIFLEILFENFNYSSNIVINYITSLDGLIRITQIKSGSFSDVLIVFAWSKIYQQKCTS